MQSLWSSSVPPNGSALYSVQKMSREESARDPKVLDVNGEKMRGKLEFSILGRPHPLERDHSQDRPE